MSGVWTGDGRQNHRIMMSVTARTNFLEKRGIVIILKPFTPGSNSEI